MWMKRPQLMRSVGRCPPGSLLESVTVVETNFCESNAFASDSGPVNAASFPVQLDRSCGCLESFAVVGDFLRFKLFDRICNGMRPAFPEQHISFIQTAETCFPFAEPSIVC
jgi:hypothetical protein